jgi:hypothetical protein
MVVPTMVCITRDHAIITPPLSSPKKFTMTNRHSEPNRAIIEKTGKLPAFILRCLKEESLMPFACIAALNYCLDYRKLTSIDYIRNM